MAVFLLANLPYGDLAVLSFLLDAFDWLAVCPAYLVGHIAESGVLTVAVEQPVGRPAVRLAGPAAGQLAGPVVLIQN